MWVARAPARRRRARARSRAAAARAARARRRAPRPPSLCASATAWRSVCRAASVSTRPSASRSAGAAGRGVVVRAQAGGEVAVAPVHGLARDAEVAADRGERRATVERADDVGPLDVVERLPQRRDPPQRGMGVGRGLELGDEPPELVAALRRLRPLVLGGGDHRSRAAGWAAGSRFGSCVRLRVHPALGWDAQARPGLAGRARIRYAPPCPRPGTRTGAASGRRRPRADIPGPLRPDRAGVDRRRVGEARDHRARARRPGQCSSRSSGPPARSTTRRTSGDEDRVVELAGDRDEVGHEVERQREVADEQREQQLAPRRGTRGSAASRPTSTMQSGMKPASARASPRRPSATSSPTASAYPARASASATSDHWPSESAATMPATIRRRAAIRPRDRLRGPRQPAVGVRVEHAARAPPGAAPTASPPPAR